MVPRVTGVPYRKNMKLHFMFWVSLLTSLSPSLPVPLINSQPLLCISLLALLLLPLSLSCDSKQTPEKVGDSYRRILQTDLNNMRESIATLLQNSSCPHLDPKIPNCTVNEVDFVDTLHILNCRMKTLKLSHVDRLVTSVQNSIQCPCKEKENKRRTSMRQKRNKLKRIERETKKLCKANAILSTMTECYAMLNTALMDT